MRGTLLEVDGRGIAGGRWEGHCRRYMGGPLLEVDDRAIAGGR